MRGVKLYVDGALGSRGAALIEPYSDDPGNLGLLVLDRRPPGGRRPPGAGGRLPGRASTPSATAAAWWRSTPWSRRSAAPRPEARFRLEHAQVLRLQDIAAHGAAGDHRLDAAHPRHLRHALGAATAWGRRGSTGAYAWRKVLDAGGRLALGSDFPVESADPRLGPLRRRHPPGPRRATRRAAGCPASG